MDLAGHAPPRSLRAAEVEGKHPKMMSGCPIAGPMAAAAEVVEAEAEVAVRSRTPRTSACWTAWRLTKLMKIDGDNSKA